MCSLTLKKQLQNSLKVTHTRYNKVYMVYIIL